MAVNAQHAFEVSFAGQRCAVADETAQCALLNVARERFALTIGTRSVLLWIAYGRACSSSCVCGTVIRGAGRRGAAVIGQLLGRVLTRLVFWIFPRSEHLLTSVKIGGARRRWQSLRPGVRVFRGPARVPRVPSSGN